MSRSPALSRVMLSSGRWLLPWLLMLLVSASLAFVMTTTVSSSRMTGDRQRQMIAPTSVVSNLPPADAVSEGYQDRVLGRSCASLFGSYNGWLFSSGGHGPCWLEPDAAPSSPPDR